YQPRITHYFPDGRTNLVATSPACFLDLKQRTVFSTNLLTVVAGTNQMTVQGIGYFGHLTNLFLIFSNDVRTVIRQELASSSRTNSGLLGNAAKSMARTNSEIHITSARLHLDYEKNLAVYYHDVHVENLTTHLRSEKLTIKRTAEGNLENILAETNVVIHQKLEPGWATADRALYYMRDGQEALMLTGSPAKWNQGERFGQAGWITYYMNERILRAEDKASVRFPLTGITHTDWLPGPRRTNAPAASLAPQFMEVHAEVITSWLAMTNRPGHRVVAQTNVVVIGFPDEMLATAANAEYVEQLGTLEFTGDGYWQQGQRIVRGERLFYDRTNQIFLSEGGSYLQVPVSEFGRQGRTNRSQLIQTDSSRFDYRNGYLTFYDGVRSTLIETNVIRGRLFADDFVRLKGTNQIERLTARRNVHGEQFSAPTRAGQMKSNKVDSEFLNVELETNGAVRRVYADTNVFAQQFRVRSNKVSRASLSAESLVADFFTHTNDLRELVANRNVVLTSDDSIAKGQRATYTASNTLVELTGSPTMETPQIKIDQADALFYDRTTGKFSAGHPQGQARAPTNGLSQTPLPGGRKL
ncbi:MAG TPA: LptA/OstA family protein, partial [Verrucomicrobiae bacterium]|nr:LptA/OstA family protein [Verrucomicrobiae bacterium]